MKTYVYIDGFNLYYQIRKTAHKWLNLKILADQLLPAGFTADRVKYYTAHVSGAVDPTDPLNQQMYLRAIATLPEVDVFFGKFMAKPIWRPLLSIPIGGRTIAPGGAVLPDGIHQISATPTTPVHPGTPVEHMYVGRYGIPSPSNPPTNAIKVRVHTQEEKGSDVNLAVHLINDGWKGNYEAAAVLSNDTDLVEAINIVTQELKKPVILLCPSPRGASQPLAKAATSVRHINPTHLKAAQFSDPVPAPAGWKPIIKPATW